MKHVQDGLSVQNISNLVLKEIYSIYKTKKTTKDQTKKYKVTEREIFEKYANLSENGLNTKNSKEVYGKNDLMTAVIKRSEGEKEKS